MAERVPFNNVSIDISGIMRDVARSANADLAKKLRLWAKTADKNVTRGKGLKEMHRELAEGSRGAILTAYTSRVGGRPSYRNKDGGRFRRYSDGRMEKAIKDPRTITYDQRGIHFIDMERMDYWAKQWYRLNFGTTSRGSRRKPSAKPMSFFGIPSGVTFSLARFPASEDFRVPKGFWSSTFADKTAGTSLALPTGSGDAFYAARKNKSHQARVGKEHPFFTGKRMAGIEGKRFLDEGAKYINSRYGKRFEKLAKSWLEIG